MSKILQQVKADLKSAMLTEIEIKKNPADGEDLIIPQQEKLKTAVTQKNVSRSIISMFPEIGKKPSDASDEDTIKLVKKYINQQKERQLYIQKHLTESDVSGINSQQLKKLVSSKCQELGDLLTSPEIDIAKKYLPNQATEGEIIEWIKNNLDLSSFKNKMQAMGPIMKHFKGADGNFIKSILLKQ